MTGTGELLFVVFVTWVFLRVISYGKWTWKKKNRIGGFMVILLGFAVLLLAVYRTYIIQ